MEDDIPSKQKQKSHTYIRQNILQAEKGNKKQRRSLCNDKRMSTSKIITIVNIYAPSTRAAKYIKQIITDLKGELKNNNTIIVR